MQQKIAVVLNSGDSLIQTPKSRNSIRRRDSWPPKLNKNLTDTAASHSSRAESPPPATVEHPVCWHWSPAVINPVPSSGDQVPSLYENEHHAHDEMQSQPAWNGHDQSVQALASPQTYSFDSAYDTDNRHGVTAAGFDGQELDAVPMDMSPDVISSRPHTESNWSNDHAGFHTSHQFASSVTNPEYISCVSSGHDPVQMEAEKSTKDQRCPPFTLVPGGLMQVQRTVPHAEADRFPDSSVYAVDEYRDMGLYRDGGTEVETGGWDAVSAKHAPAASSDLQQAVLHQEPGFSGTGQVMADTGADVSSGAAALGGGHSGALAEGKLAKLAKKQKDWVDHYCILSCKPREGAAFGGIDFAYMLDFFESRALAAGGHEALESIHAGHAAVKFVQGPPRPHTS